MSQNPNEGPNHNPYGPGPSYPNYPPAPGPAYGNAQPSTGPDANYGQPPSGPNPNYPLPSTGPNPGYPQPPAGSNPNYGMYAPPPPPPPPGSGDSTPNSGYGLYNAPYQPDQMAGPYDPTVFSQSAGATYPAYPPPASPPSAPGFSTPPGTPQSMPGFGGPPSAPGFGMPQNQPRFGEAPTQPSIQPPTKKSNTKMILISALALLIVIGGVVGIVFYNQYQIRTHDAQATATAQIQAQNTSAAQTATALANAQATATAIKTHYPFSANLVLNDPLSDNSGATKYGWDVGNGCAFTNGTYEVTENTANFIQPCTAQKTNFANFTFEIQMTIKAGGTGALGGVFFRANMDTDKLYLFMLGTDGYYGLGVRANSSGTSNRTLKSGTIPNFATGTDQVHTIGIVANGPLISIYIDQALITQNPISDPTYTSGQIGVVADYGSSTTTVDYTNAKVWQL